MLGRVHFLLSYFRLEGFVYKWEGSHRTFKMDSNVTDIPEHCRNSSALEVSDQSIEDQNETLVLIAQLTSQDMGETFNLSAGVYHFSARQKHPELQQFANQMLNFK